MKKYLLHICFFFLVLVLVQTIKVWITPFYWGRARMAQKMEYLLENSQHYNTYIMGSSKVHSNYDPVVFDKTISASQKIKTFNLGCNGSTFDENYYVLKNILPKLHSPKYILFQVTRLRALAVNETEAVERRYFMDLDVMKHLLRVFDGKEIRSNIYYKSLLNLFSTGESLRRVRYTKNVADYDRLAPQLSETHGYFNTKIEEDDWVVTGRNKRANIYYEKNLKDQLEKHGQTDANAYRPDDSLINWLYDIKRLCELNGVEVVFFSVPNEEYILPDDLNYIYMGDGINNPQFFKLENHLDHVHVFKEGAAIYSAALANKFIRFLN